MIATTFISIYRGTLTDAFADVVDDNTTPLATGVPASIIEQSRRVYVPAEDRIQTIRYLIGRVLANIDIKAGDRVRDERTSTRYSVDAVHQVQSVGYTADLVLDLRAV